MAPLTSMLKTAMLLEKLTSDRLKVGNSEGGISIGGDGIELAKKSRKLKSQKLA